MENNDILKFTIMIVGIGELYGKAISEQLTDIYWQALKRFEFRDVQRALKAHINNPDCGQYFPKPADVVRFIEGGGETKALHAWTKVENAIYQVGSYRSLAFDDPLIHIVLEEMGGWIKLCAMTLREMPFRANEFQKRYMGYVNKAPNRYPSYLYGIFECENAKNGYPIEPPLLVGDEKKAKQVMATGGDAPPLVHISQAISDFIKTLPPSRAKEKDDEL